MVGEFSELAAAIREEDADHVYWRKRSPDRGGDPERYLMIAFSRSASMMRLTQYSMVSCDASTTISGFGGTS